MRIDRRTFLAAGMAAAGMPWRAMGSLARREDRYFEWKPVLDNAHVAFGDGGNVLVVVGAEDSFLVDAKLAGRGEQLRREAEAFGPAISELVNTHHHADHTGGNPSFVERTTNFCHFNARTRILKQRDKYREQTEALLSQLAGDDRESVRGVERDARALLEKMDAEVKPRFLPTRFINSDTGGGWAAGMPYELEHVCAAHTDNDMFVVLPELNVMHAGDLLFSGLHPFFDRASGATVHGWIRFLERAIARCDDETVVIPGHGEITDVSGLKRQQAYLGAVRDAVAEVVRAGQPRDEALAIRLDCFEGLGFEQLRDKVLGEVYDELSDT